MDSKLLYKTLCEKESTIPIFSKYWWLDAVCGKDNWNVLLVEKGGQIVASLPYYIKKKMGIKYVTQPQLTQVNGIWIKYPNNQKYATRLSFEKDVMEEIINQLDALDITHYNQNFHYSITNWLPFYWNGYKQTTKYTYVIEDLNDLEKVYSEFQPKVKTDIKKAQKMVEIKENCDLETFYNINRKTFERQGINIPYSFDLVSTLDNACVQKNCRKIFYAEDENKKIHAVVYIVWDEESVYYLLGGGDPEYRNSGATSLLIWNAIQFASKVAKKFDFEGSMLEPVERFCRGFGAKQKPYFNIYRLNKRRRLSYLIMKGLYSIYNRK